MRCWMHTFKRYESIETGMCGDKNITVVFVDDFFLSTTLTITLSTPLSSITISLLYFSLCYIMFLYNFTFNNEVSELSFCQKKITYVVSTFFSRRVTYWSKISIIATLLLSHRLEQIKTSTCLRAPDLWKMAWLFVTCSRLPYSEHFDSHH